MKNKRENPRKPHRQMNKQPKQSARRAAAAQARQTGAKVREKAAGGKTRRPETKPREGTSEKIPVAA